jgi:hypothetical protein
MSAHSTNQQFSPRCAIPRPAKIPVGSFAFTHGFMSPANINHAGEIKWKNISLKNKFKS